MKRNRLLSVILPPSLFLAAVLFSASAYAQTRTHRAARTRGGRTASPTAELERLSEEVARAYANHDAEALGRLEADDYQGTMTDGKVITKAEDISAERTYASKGPMASPVEVKSDDVKVHVFGLVALVTGVVIEKPSGQERSVRFTQVFHKRQGKWRLVAAQWTAVGSQQSQPQAATGGEVTTPSGLKYVDIVVGTGASPSQGSMVTVNYVGTLEDGRKFDSSYDRGQPFTFPIGVGRVIKGWDEGVMTMKVGGKRRLIIPSNLAYGPLGRPPVIPPKATLIFEVELLSVR